MRVERTSDVPKMKFIAKMKMPRNRPPLMDRSHLLPVFARMMSGTCNRKDHNQRKDVREHEGGCEES